MCKVVGTLVTTSCRCKLSRKYGSSTGCTEYACGVGVGEVDPAVGHRIEVGGDRLVVATEETRPVVHVIDGDEKNVGAGFFSLQDGRQEDPGNNKQSADTYH